MITSRVTSKGRITVPPEVCAILGLQPGDRLAYEIDGDQVILSKGGAGELSELDDMIDAALADDRPSISIDEGFTEVLARIEARARRKDAA